MGGLAGKRLNTRIGQDAEKSGCQAQLHKSPSFNFARTGGFNDGKWGKWKMNGFAIGMIIACANLFRWDLLLLVQSNSILNSSRQIDNFF